MTENKRDMPDTWVDPDDAPELTDAWFQAADQHKGGKLVKRGRPALAHPKKHINIRLDADLVDRLLLYRAPILIGGGRPALGDIGLADLPAAHGRWRMTDQRRFDADSLDVYLRTR